MLRLRHIFKKLGIKLRDVLIFSMLLLIFLIFKAALLHFYLRMTHKSFNQEVSLKEFCNAELVKENAQLKKILEIKEKENSQNFVVAKVLTNIYSSTCFFVFSSKSSVIKKNAPVWAANDGVLGSLIGFVENIDGNFVQIRPLTHIKSKFSVVTESDIGFLVKGNGKFLEVILSSNSCKCEKVFFKSDVGVFFVGYYENGVIKPWDFGKVKFVCISI